jgi:ornithine cyclodeaminase/alanine dehydrogenase-like protein (mu-crystallin family)
VDIVSEIAEKCAQELELRLGFLVRAIPLENRKDAVCESEIVITVTTGNQALVEHGWLKPGAFIARLGSYQEVALDVLLNTDKVVVDNWKYVSLRIPEIIQLVAEGRFSEEKVYATWPDIAGGRIPGRASRSEIILFVALGIWGEYAAILPEVYRRAKAQGLGQKLPSFF